MKTLFDVITSAEKNDVIKKYKVNGIPIELKAHNFNTAFKLIKGQNISFPELGNLRCELHKIDTSNFVVKIIKSYFEECHSCDGTGEHYCSDCSDYHECTPCGGTGVIYNEVIDDVLLLEEGINLNQGELF